jgi:hypothetical protein
MVAASAADNADERLAILRTAGAVSGLDPGLGVADGASRPR